MSRPHTFLRKYFFADGTISNGEQSKAQETLARRFNVGYAGSCYRNGDWS